MKSVKLVGAIVPFIVAGLSAVANAQNSITLYGRIDNGIAFVNNASGTNDLVTLRHGLSNSRFGFKGAEQLGGGLTAIFQLENGFNESTGALGNGGRIFGRQAFVGLADQTWGTVTMGRQYDPLVDLIQPITADNFFSSVTATPGDVDNWDNSLRVNNAVKYLSPTWSGFTVEAVYGLGGVSGSLGQGATYSGAVSYSLGNMSLAGGYFRATNPSPNTGAKRNISSATNAWTGSSDPLFDSVINNGYISAASVSIARVGAQYVIGQFILAGTYSNSQYRSDGFSTFTGSGRFNTGAGSITYQWSPALSIGAGYTYLSASGNASATYNQYFAGAVYSLSKRTSVYAVAGYQHAGGEQLVQNSNGKTTVQPAQASVGSFGYAGTNNQAIAIVGLRTGF
ncbi:porin [Paraburkholderia sp.]|uniref:porin n=1 Tax=Paraburkholderia sp. TaxID=1926495 RepID=UPI0039E631FE